MNLFLFTLCGVYFYLMWKLIAYQRFKVRRSQVICRVHVNGIRGKSTVTRYISAVFRAAGYHTFGKTTGTAARIIRPDGKDYDFKRKGHPNVNEQIKILNHFCRQKAEVIVMECMAINPVYAKWLEEQVMQSHIMILTNVRYDHPEYLGGDLTAIAKSLTESFPRNGIIITPETDLVLLPILWKEATKKNSQIAIVSVDQVTDEDLEKFPHYAHKENVAIGYEIAKLFKLPLPLALEAMQNCESDPGAFKIQHIDSDGKTVAWANLFSVNDRESFVNICQNLFSRLPYYYKIIILNNRNDRPSRVKLFSKLAIKLDFDRVVTFGDYEDEVKESFRDFPEKLICLGNSSNYKDLSGSEILYQITKNILEHKILIIGGVNIHTHQAERLVAFFESLK